MKFGARLYFHKRVSFLLSIGGRGDGFPGCIHQRGSASGGGLPPGEVCRFRGGVGWVCIGGGGFLHPGGGRGSVQPFWMQQTPYMGYGQQAGGMHPTGMHSSLTVFVHYI